jgi:hypothetical protein
MKADSNYSPIFFSLLLRLELAAQNGRDKNGSEFRGHQQYSVANWNCRPDILRQFYSALQDSTRAKKNFSVRAFVRGANLTKTLQFDRNYIDVAHNTPIVLLARKLHAIFL